MEFSALKNGLLDGNFPGEETPRENTKPWCSRTFSSMGPGSLRGSVITLSSGAIGAGLLSLHLAIRDCGLVLGVFFLIASAFSFGFYYRTLIIAMKVSNKDDYVSIVRFFYGTTGKRIAEFSSFVLLFGVCCAYQAIIVQFWMSVIVSLGFIPPDYLYYLLNAVVTVIFIVLSIPQKLTSFRYISSGSLIALLYITLLVIFQAPFYISRIEDFGSKIRYVNFDLSIVNSITIMVFAYNNIMLVPNIQRELARKSYRRGMKYIVRGLSMTAALYIALGVAGYLSYIDRMVDLVVDREIGSHSADWPMLVGKMIFGTTLIANYIINLHPLRDMAENFISKTENNRNMPQFYALNFFLVILSGLFATNFPSVVSYFKILGGFTTVILAIIFPTMIYWKLPTTKRNVVLVTVWSSLLALVGFSSATLTILGR